MRTKRFKSRKVKKRRTYKKRGGAYYFANQHGPLTEAQSKQRNRWAREDADKAYFANAEKRYQERMLKEKAEAKKAAEAAAAAEEAAEKLRLQQESFFRSAYTNENKNKQNMGLRAPEKIAQDAKKKSQNAKKESHLLSTSGNPLHQGP